MLSGVEAPGHKRYSGCEAWMLSEVDGTTVITLTAWMLWEVDALGHERYYGCSAWRSGKVDALL